MEKIEFEQLLQKLFEYRKKEIAGNLYGVYHKLLPQWKEVGKREDMEQGRYGIDQRSWDVLVGDIKKEKKVILEGLLKCWEDYPRNRGRLEKTVRTMLDQKKRNFEKRQGFNRGVLKFGAKVDRLIEQYVDRDITTLLEDAFHLRVRAIAGDHLDQYLKLEGVKKVPSLYAKKRPLDGGRAKGPASKLKGILEAIALERKELLSIDKEWKSSRRNLRIGAESEYVDKNWGITGGDWEASYLNTMAQLRSEVLERTRYIVFENGPLGMTIQKSIGTRKSELQREALGKFVEVNVAAIWATIFNSDGRDRYGTYWDAKNISKGDPQGGPERSVGGMGPGTGAQDSNRVVGNTWDRLMARFINKCVELSGVIQGWNFEKDPDCKNLKRKISKIKERTIQEEFKGKQAKVRALAKAIEQGNHMSKKPVNAQSNSLTANIEQGIVAKKRAQLKKKMVLKPLR